MYLFKLRDGKCGGWGLTDTSQCDGDDNDFDYNDLRDCVVLWAVTVPGETVWYQTASNGDSELSVQSEFSQEGFDIVIKRAAASQHAEPLRAHKYPIPKDKHHGLQIKVGIYTST
jgi:hypothetical protein